MYPDDIDELCDRLDELESPTPFEVHAPGALSESAGDGQGMTLAGQFPLRILMRIIGQQPDTGSPGTQPPRNRYSWVALAVDGDGNLYDSDLALAGTYDGDGNGAAIEQNGNLAVPVGTPASGNTSSSGGAVVWGTQAESGEHWLFSYCCEKPSPAGCLVFYSAYLHLQEPEVVENQSLQPGERVGYLTAYPNGAHLHLSIGDGQSLLTSTPADNSVVGQTFDANDVFGLPTIGLRLPGLTAPGTSLFSASDIAAIKARLGLPVDASKNWVLALGSSAHYGKEYYAHDITVPPPTDTTEAGEPVYNVAASDDVTTTVWRKLNLGGDHGWALLLRHQFGPTCGSVPAPPGTGTLGYTPHDVVDSGLITGDHIAVDLLFSQGLNITIATGQSLVITGVGTADACFELPIGIDKSMSWGYDVYEFTSNDSTQISAVDAPIVLMYGDGVVTQLNLAGIVPINTCDGGQVLLIANDDNTLDLTIKHGTGATVTSRFELPGAADWVIPPGESRLFWYDLTLLRWRPVGCECSSATSPTAINGTAALGSRYDLTGSFASSGLTVSIPSAGTYLLLATVSSYIDGSQHQYNQARMHDGASVVGPVGHHELAATTAAQELGQTFTLHAIYTAAGAATITLQGMTTSTGTAGFAATETTMSFAKLDT